MLINSIFTTVYHRYTTQHCTNLRKIKIYELNTSNARQLLSSLSLRWAVVDVLVAVRARRDVGSWARVRSEDGEGRGARLLDVAAVRAGGEGGGLRDGWFGRRDDLGAVVELADVVAEHGHLRHRLREPLHHQVVVR